MAKTPTDKTMTERASETARGAAKEMADKARDTVQDVADDAADRAKVEAEVARDRAAEEVDKVANAAEAAAGEFDDRSMQARAIEEVARRVDDIAAHVRSTDIDRMARTLGDAARRHPLMFVAGAALAGFAATRFLKARDPAERYGAMRGDPWQSGPRDDWGSHMGSTDHGIPPAGAQR